MQHEIKDQQSSGQFKEPTKQPAPNSIQNSHQLDDKADYLTTCSEGVGNGFGPSFFNVRDPNFTRRNDPVPVPSSMHMVLLVFSIIFIACLIVGLVGLDNFIPLWAMILMIVGSYILYLCLGCYCSDIKAYIDNMKPFSDYQGTYDKMTKGRGYFSFYIECYHYQTRTTGSGKHRSTTTVKVVTHTARQNYVPLESTDESGQLQGIFDTKPYIFLQYLPRYYFTDDTSQNIFRAAFNYFVSINRRDVYQSYTHTFKIENHEEFVSYSATGEGTKTRVLFYIFTLLGLGIFYACIIERAIARYEIGILKRLTCR